MSEEIQFRFHRMAPNSAGWRKPSPGRLGTATDYVGTTGFGHEDWNFARDLWKDGKYHLFLRGQPAKSDKNKKFNIALTSYTKLGHALVGFCENARFTTSSLPRSVWRRRAKQLIELGEGNIEEFWLNKNIEVIVKSLIEGPEVYWAAVAPEDLYVLDAPVIAPNEILKTGSHRYILYKLNERDYATLKKTANAANLTAESDESVFPEGAVVERLHKTRERSARAVLEAKKRFLASHGDFFCEACGWTAGENFPSISVRNKLIEAHHDIPLSSIEHTGITHSKDIRFLCPNCHRAIHAIRPWLLVDSFKAKFFP